MTAKDIPHPTIDDDNRPYWEACQRHELVIQRCADCGSLVLPPRAMCPRCNSFEREWPRASGRGRVFSWVGIHPPVLPCFADKVPFPVAVVELEEGPRMVGELVGIKMEDIEIGMPVEVVFEDIDEELTLPNFKRAL